MDTTGLDLYSPWYVVFSGFADTSECHIFNFSVMPEEEEIIWRFIED